MKKRYILVLFAVFALILITNCSKDKKKYIIPKDDFEAILVDIHLMDGVVRQHNFRNKLARKNDTLDYYDAILRSHNYTRAQYDSSVVYYSENLGKFDDIYENVLSELNRMEAKAEDEIDKQRKRKQQKKEQEQREQEKRLGNPYKIELGSKVKIKR
jgi:hypothetical protein